MRGAQPGPDLGCDTAAATRLALDDERRRPTGSARSRRSAAALVQRHDGVFGGEGGVATVWAAIGVAVLVTVLAGALDVAGAVAARHRAEAAADLAALAAAGQAARGTATACGRAGEVAADVGTRVVFCRLTGWEALVEVELRTRSSLAGGGRARGRARAGPATARPAISAAEPVGTPP